MLKYQIRLPLILLWKKLETDLPKLKEFCSFLPELKKEIPVNFRLYIIIKLSKWKNKLLTNFYAWATSNYRIMFFNIFFCLLKNFFGIKFWAPIFMATKCHHLTSVVTSCNWILLRVITAFFLVCENRLKKDVAG